MSRVWVFRIFSLLILLCLLAVGATFVWFYSLDGAQKRQFLADLVTEYTGATLKIEGDVSISLWGRPGLEITEIQLTFPDQPHRLQAGELTLKLSYSSLLARNPMLAHVGVEDAVITLDLQQEAPVYDIATDQAIPVESLPPVQSLLLKRTQVQLLGTQYPVNVWFKRAQLSNLQHFSPLNLDAEFDLIIGERRESVDLDLTIKGQASSARSHPLLNPMTFSLNARSEHIYLEGRGTLDRPAHLSGLNAQIQLQADLDSYLQALSVGDQPLNARLQLQSSISGNYRSLSIDGLTATLLGGTALTARLTGKQIPLDDPWSASLALSAQISDQALLTPLLPDDYPLPELLTIEGQVSPGQDALRAKDLKIELASSNSLALFIQGDTDIGYQSPRFRQTDLNFSFIADTTRDAGVLIFPGVPELGAAKGSARLYEQGDDLRIEDVKIILGDNKLGGRISGSIERMPLDANPNRGMTFDFDLFSLSTEDAGALFNTHLPELGPVQLKGRFQGDREASNLTDLLLTAGSQDGVQLTVSGQLALLDLMADSPIGPGDFDLVLAAQPAGLKGALPDKFQGFGPLSLAAKLEGVGDIFAAKNITLSAGRDQFLTLNASGEIAQIPITNPLAMQGIATRWTMSADSTAPLLSLIGGSRKWDLGPLHGEFGLSGSLNRLLAEQIQVSVGQAEDLLITVSGAIGPVSMRDEFKLKGIELAISATTSSTAALESVAGIDLPDVGDITASAQLTDEDGTLGLEPIVLGAHKPDEIRLNAEGKLDDLADLDEIRLTTDVEIADLSLVEVVADVDDPNPVPLSGKGVISLTDDKHLEIRGDLQLGSSKIDLEIYGEPTAVRYQVAGDIRSQRIALTDLGISPTTKRKTDTAVESPADENTVIFTDQDWADDLQIPFDLSLNLLIDKLLGEELVLQDLLASVSLQQDRIAIEPFKFIYSGGEAELNGRYSFGQTEGSEVHQPGKLEVGAKVKNLPIARLISQFNTTATRDGHASLMVNLNATGSSPKALVASLDGRVGLVVENLRVLRRYLKLLAVDFLGWAISTSVESDSYGRIDCSIFRLSADKGRLTFDELMMDGPDMLLRGEGNIDLNQEQVNMVLLPKKKRQFFTSVTPVKIRGELANPNVSAIPYKAAAKEFGAFVVAPMIYVPVRALGYLFGTVSDDEKSAEDHPCLKYTVH